MGCAGAWQVDRRGFSKSSDESVLTTLRMSVLKNQPLSSGIMSLK